MLLRAFASAASWLLVLVQVGCATGAAPGSTSPSVSGGPAPDEGANKTLVIAQASPFAALGPFATNSTAGGGATLLGVHSTGLVSLDSQGKQIGRIAAGLPSLADGSIVLLPDGRMRTTWRLRPDVTWHDGTRFTADDVVFTQKVRAKVTPGNPEDVSPHIEQIDVIDPLTAVITWKTNYYNALFLDFRSFWLLPDHLLGKALDEDNQEAFLGNPYFTTEYVNTGPFRLVDWGLGTDMTFERYPGYFLGVPKVGRIIIKSIADQNVIAAGVRAGTIDMVANKALSANLSVVLRDEWKASGEGSVLNRQENWIYLQYQWDPQQTRPPELPGDVRLRTGMYEALDRTALREFQFPGVPDTNGDSFMPAADPRGTIVGQPFARYMFDPTRAAAHLVEGGWTRTADGRFLDRAGNPVQIDVRVGGASDQAVVAVVADMWRRIGLEVNEYNAPQVFGRQGAEVAQWPGLQLTGRGAAEIALSQFQTKQIPTAENRWTGQNTGSYSNPVLDRLFDQVYATLDGNERANLLKQVGEAMAADLPALPIYWRISFMELRNTVKGSLADDHAHMGQDINGYNLSHSAHLWERA